MPDINLSWTPAPANANSIGQRAKAIARVNGSVPNMTAVFIPANNMGVAVNSAIFRTSNFNIAYRFMVENICSSGGPIANTNGVREGIVFACIPPTVKAGDTTTTTYRARILKGMYTQVDSVNYPNAVSSISAIEFTLYNAANTQPIANQGPFKVTTITGVGSSESFEHLFLSLTPGTAYTLRYVLFATVNNIEVRSDAAQYLGVPCLNNTVNTPASQACLDYTVSNTTFAFMTVYYTRCDIIAGQITLSPNTSSTICALENTVVAQAGLTITLNGPCAIPPPAILCKAYRLDNTSSPQGGQSGTFNYTDCAGVYQSNNVTLAPNNSVTICAYENTVAPTSSAIIVTDLGLC